MFIRLDIYDTVMDQINKKIAATSNIVATLSNIKIFEQEGNGIFEEPEKLRSVSWTIFN